MVASLCPVFFSLPLPSFSLASVSCPGICPTTPLLPGRSRLLPLDVMEIEEGSFLSPGWEPRFPNNTIVAESVVAIATRQGNPKQIKGWADLVRCAEWYP
jgi:hypothetical protein